MENFLLWVFYVMTFYAFLPGVISRTFGFRVFKRGKAEKEIALTFDDGPDSNYTPQLLDLLKRYNAKATFFVVGSHAEKELDLLRRMKDEGHDIGIHNYVHKSNWLMRPRTVKRQIEKTNAIIETATGERSNYYRPPWGIVNLFDYSNLGYLQIILWSSLFGDWRIRVGAERLQRRMMKKLRPGEVLLLHDCGKTFGADKAAPRNMLIALEAYLEQGTQQGYSFVNITQMIKLSDASRKPSLIKRTLISLWLLWEKAFHAAFRLKQVGESDQPSFHYRVTTYSGQTVEFAEGGTIGKGDAVAELHFDNGMLSRIAARYKSPLAAGLRVIREVEHALPQLAMQLAEDPDASDIKAVYGVTMIHRGADRLGFEVFRLPDGLFARSTNVYLRLLTKVLTPSDSGKRQKERSKRLKDASSPRMLLMPMQRVRQYAAAGLSNLQEGTADLLRSPVDRAIAGAADESSAIGSKTTAL
ncbi:polysaccharide deacetylase family protein [Paenibacillus sp. J5C_2022]|uniref:polysaccharide deacetylase family protein n=1 Tax=Paenibacillus sp. J5C2022 TaxID=2977129 RepID=UPI0021CFA19C|nr:polysaccharide deacetylase family protein [Paenibacillus sp. J5C2022]MCU6709643.1 polysaccharide deacetylase family protein [Paenibacillus sp. J5C2022]